MSRITRSTPSPPMTAFTKAEPKSQFELNSQQPKRGRNDLSSDRPISGVVSGVVSANKNERAKKPLKSFIRNNKECQRRALLRRRAIRRARLDNVLPQHPFGIDLDLRCENSDSDTSSDSFSRK
ncbi:hypothetical protein K438DRAFT_1754137 [Mycena galopus ATCC 62051]|nr:hypothetical protein K438DRAFT_1754137 [Mycena galopus ATCC 62051]